MNGNMLAVTLTDVLIVAAVCIGVLFMIVVYCAYRIEARGRMRTFFAGRDVLTDRDFCRRVGSDLLDEGTCAAVRLAVGSQVGRDTEALLQPEDPVRTLMSMAFDGGDLVELFRDLEDHLRTTFSRKDMDGVLGGEMPPESLTLGEFAVRLARHLKSQSEPEAASETAEKP